MKALNEFDRDLDLFTDRILADVEALPRQPAPIGAVKLTRAEQLERYAAMRTDPQAWAKIWQEQGPEGAFKYAHAMERQMEAANA